MALFLINVSSMSSFVRVHILLRQSETWILCLRKKYLKVVVPGLGSAPPSAVGLHALQITLREFLIMLRFGNESFPDSV